MPYPSSEAELDRFVRASMDRWLPGAGVPRSGAYVAASGSPRLYGPYKLTGLSVAASTDSSFDIPVDAAAVGGSPFVTIRGTSGYYDWCYLSTTFPGGNTLRVWVNNRGAGTANFDLVAVVIA